MEFVFQKSKKGTCKMSEVVTNKMRINRRKSFTKKKTPNSIQINFFSTEIKNVYDSPTDQSNILKLSFDFESDMLNGAHVKSNSLSLFMRIIPVRVGINKRYWDA